MRKTTSIIAAGAAALGLATSAVAATKHGQQSTSTHHRSAVGSRLDDGKNLLRQSKITEQEAIRAAQSAASGALDEVDLEHKNGKLVWNVDVGDKDVKVDAANGKVVAVDHDD